jgi:hypothetical protein
VRVNHHSELLHSRAGGDGVGALLHTSAYVSIRFCIRQHSSCIVVPAAMALAHSCMRQHSSAFVSIRQLVVPAAMALAGKHVNWW